MGSMAGMGMMIGMGMMSGMGTMARAGMRRSKQGLRKGEEAAAASRKGSFLAQFVLQEDFTSCLFTCSFLEKVLRRVFCPLFAAPGGNGGKSLSST